MCLMTQYFLCPNILSANKQILNSHITRCPKITVFENPQGGGGEEFSYLVKKIQSQGSFSTAVISKEITIYFLQNMIN